MLSANTLRHHPPRLIPHYVSSRPLLAGRLQFSCHCMGIPGPSEFRTLPAGVRIGEKPHVMKSSSTWRWALVAQSLRHSCAFREKASRILASDHIIRPSILQKPNERVMQTLRSAGIHCWRFSSGTGEQMSWKLWAGIQVVRMRL